MKQVTRRWLARSILLAVYIGLMVLMLVSGKQHTILIDNKDDPLGSYEAIDGMSVQIDNLESAEYYPGDRDRAVVQGQRHRIRVELFDDERVIEREFSVPFNQDMVLLSVPRLVSGMEPFIEPFTVQLEQARDDTANTQETEHQQFGTDAAGIPLDLTAPGEMGIP